MTIVCFPLDAVSGAPTYTGEMLRQALSSITGGAPAGRPLGAVSGVRPGTPTTAVTATSSTWTTTPHAGVLDVETSATAGPYLYAVGANVTGSMTAADATNPRVDIVYAQLSDPAEGDGTTTPQVQILYLAGTPAASPSPPATPARSLVLAQITVPKSGSGSPSVTWVAPITPQLGTHTVSDWNAALTPGFYTANGAANAPASGVYAGLVVQSSSSSAVTQIVWKVSVATSSYEQWIRLYSSTSWGAWTQIGHPSTNGSTNITPSGVNVVTSVSVNFGMTFASAPQVFCQFTTGISGSGTCFVWPTNVTTTGFTLNINRSTTTTTAVSWYAVL